mgnify:CR=1 FL=1
MVFVPVSELDADRNVSPDYNATYAIHNDVDQNENSHGCIRIIDDTAGKALFYNVTIGMFISINFRSITFSYCIHEILMFLYF